MVHCVLNTSGYKYTHTQGVTLIAFPFQQWFLEYVHKCYVLGTLSALFLNNLATNIQGHGYRELV